MKNKSLLEILEMLDEALVHVVPHQDVEEDCDYYHLCIDIIICLKKCATNEYDIRKTKKYLKKELEKLNKNKYLQE